MKKFLCLSWMVLISGSFFGQAAMFDNIKKLIREKYPEVQVDNKVVGVTLWNVTDQNSRENNMAFEKAFEVYQMAKLKGGPDGFIVLAVNKNDTDAEISLVILQDGLSRLLNLKKSDLAFNIKPDISNITYDMTGKELSRNLSADQIFPSIQKLILR